VKLHKARDGPDVKEIGGYQRVREEKPAQQQQGTAEGVGCENDHRKQAHYHKQAEGQVAQRAQPDEKPGPKEAAVVVALAGGGQHGAEGEHDERVPQQQRREGVQIGAHAAHEQVRESHQIAALGVHIVAVEHLG
jgi:hypothetical protein